MQQRLSEYTREVERTYKSRPFVRAAVCELITHKERGFRDDIIRRLYPNDREVDTLTRAMQTRAAASPATQANTTQFSMVGATDFIGSLRAVSAGAMLLQRGTQFRFDGTGSLSIAALSAAATNVGFVVEGSPIPVRQKVFSSVTLAPRKFASISVFTREVLNHSLPNVETTVHTTLNDDTALALDTAMLDATAGDTSRPAGLRNGISAVGTASTATSVDEAMRADLKAVIAPVAAIAGNSPIILVCAPPQAVSLRLRSRVQENYEILASGGLADGTICAIATNALVSACDPVPRFETADQIALHMEDTSPAALSLIGTPAIVSYPIRSTWQTDSISLRMIFEVSWAIRSTSGLAWISSITKW